MPALTPLWLFLIYPNSISLMYCTWDPFYVSGYPQYLELMTQMLQIRSKYR